MNDFPNHVEDVAAEQSYHSDKFDRAKREAKNIVGDVDKEKSLVARAQKLMSCLPGCEDFAVMIEIAELTWKGAYRPPWEFHIALLAGLVYLVSPLDCIPDTIPVVGYLDDAAVMMWISRKYFNEIEAFKKWKIKNSDIVDNSKKSPCDCVLL
tara:strand:- start:76 stop:534 length:459 start_codon:yes stop_codon:yes gene_type:complete